MGGKKSGYCHTSKKNCSFSVSNYRPTSLLNNFSKVSEFVIHDHMSHYFKHKLNASQHGFFETTSAITTFVAYLDLIFLLHSSHAGLWYPRSRVRSRPKPSDFSGEKIHSMPSLGGGSKAVSHVADLRGMSKNPGFTCKSKSQAKLTGHFSPVIPSFADRVLSCLHVEAPRGESGNV